MDTRIARLLLGATMALVVLAPARSLAQGYQITDLGSLGGAQGSGAYALSGTGIAAGYSFVSGTGLVHAMVNDRGQVVDLGTLGGTQSLARAVNASGAVVGWAYPPGLALQRAFVWRDGVMTPLGTFGGDRSDASDINDDGLIVGSAYDALSRERPFWWRDGVLHDLGTLGGSQGRALAVNGWGDIVGTAQVPGDAEYHAFLGKPGSPLYDLGTLGGPASHAHDVNDQVHVCGWSMLRPNDPASRGFLWADGVIKSLGTLGGIYSAAFGLNDRDEVVGATTRADEVQVAFLWRNDQMIDLNTLPPPGHGWWLRSAYDIDEQGAIVGEGLRPDGEARAFLLTPTVATAVPPDPDRAGLRFAGARPNPVRGSARFAFEQATAGHVRMSIHDLAGRRVRVLADGDFPAGAHAVPWDGRAGDGSPLAPGAYLARLETVRGVATARFVVVR